MMFSIRDFSAGFIIGLGSGIAFRSLADNDFASVRDILKTGIGVAQKAGDVVSDGFGRLRESVEDMRATIRSEKVRSTASKVKARERSIASGGQRRNQRRSQRRKSSVRRAARYHA